MTITSKTIKKIKELKAEKVPDHQISQRLKISLNTVAKYKNNDKEEQHTDERKEVKKVNDFSKLEEELRLAGLKPEIKERLSMAIDCLEDVEEPSSEALLNKANFLASKLEDTTDLKIIQWIEKKCYEIIQQALEYM